MPALPDKASMLGSYTQSSRVRVSRIRVVGVLRSTRSSTSIRGRFLRLRDALVGLPLDDGAGQLFQEGVWEESVLIKPELAEDFRSSAPCGFLGDNEIGVASGSSVRM